MKPASIADVVDYQQCCGCGACAWAMPETYEMSDVIELGLRPLRRSGAGHPVDDTKALKVCPGIGLSRSPVAPSGVLQELFPAWGPIMDVWEGHASDPQLRFEASSGGAATALGIYAIEQGGMHGVLHIKARDDVPYLNRTVLSTTAAELLVATGSRYAPASPCDGLALVESAPGPCVFIGKPCDVAATHKASSLSSSLERKLGLTVAMFCAGTPSTLGTMKMLEGMNVKDPSQVRELRYRGRGWPGDAIAKIGDGASAQERRLTYQQSWGDILQKYRQWRCHVCADHTGEFADISVGDPWYRDIPPGETGRSLILIRTERGRRVFAGALAAGLITAARVDPCLLAASQPNLLKGRGAIWGRIATLRILGLPAPRYRGLPMWPFWLSELGWVDKVRSITGTLRRVWSRRLYKRWTRGDPSKALLKRFSALVARRRVERQRPTEE